MDALAIGASAGTGGGLGLGEYFIDKEDAKRAVAAGGPIPVVQQYGTWYSYGIPVVSILLTAFGVLKGDWATRLLAVGGTLAGRKIPAQIEAPAAVGYSRWNRENEARRAAAEAARARARGGGGGGAGLPLYVDEEEILS